MTSILKDNVGGAPPLLLLPTGEQQIVVSVLFFILIRNRQSKTISRLLAVFDQ